MIVEKTLDIGGRVLPVEVRINRRARRYIIRADSLRGVVQLTVPSKRSIPSAMRFAKERASWIEACLDEGPRAISFCENLIFPFRGVDHRLVHQPGELRLRTKLVPAQDVQDAHIEGDPYPKLLVGGEASHINRRVTDWLRREARKVLTARTDFYCQRLEVKRGKIRIGDTKSRWGSCSADGTIAYSWRLILCPPEILDYVVAHECTHLIHLDHSAAFWRRLASLDVDARAAKRWFDKNGAELFAWGNQSGMDRAA